jgi:hypothetical protein
VVLRSLQAPSNPATLLARLELYQSKLPRVSNELFVPNNVVRWVHSTFFFITSAQSLVWGLGNIDFGPGILFECHANFLCLALRISHNVHYAMQLVSDCLESRYPLTFLTMGLDFGNGSSVWHPWEFFRRKGRMASLEMVKVLPLTFSM